MAQKIVLSETFTDTSLPKLYDEPGMSAGTLLLIDPSRQSGAFTDLSNGALIPNIASAIAGPILSASGDAIKSNLLLVRDGPASLKIERSAKGGIHALSSQTNQTSAVNSLEIQMSDALRTYILNNISHGWYASVWLMPTRAGIASPAPSSPAQFTASASPSGNALWHFQGLSPAPFPNNPGYLGRKAPPSVVGTPDLWAVGASAFQGATPANIANARGVALGAGRAGGFGAQNANPSWVLYRAIIEDLSLTRRANGGQGGTPTEEFAAALASDQAQFAAAFGAGGRFHGDTVPTSPSAYP